MKEDELQLGSDVQDCITLFEGVATGCVRYVSGCVQVLVAPRVDGEGKMRTAEWFDIQRIVRVGNAFVSLDNAATPGPDRLPPRR